MLIDVLRGWEPAVQWLASLQEVPSCSELTRAEVLRGVRSPERGRTERLLASLQWVAVDEPISRRGGELGRRYRRSHPGVGIVDLLIAGTVELFNAELKTSNIHHYPMFPGLAPPYRS